MMGHGFAWYLARLIPLPSERLESREKGVRPLGPQACYGCCPSCGEFVGITPASPTASVPCPGCGQLIGPANPLRAIGAEGRSRAPLWDRELDG